MNKTELEKAAKDALKQDETLCMVLTEQGMNTASTVYPRAFIAGYNHAVDSAYDGFDAWYLRFYGTAWEAWQAAKLSSQKEIKLLNGQLELIASAADRAGETIQKLTKKNKIMEDALGFYADKKQWSKEDARYPEYDDVKEMVSIP